jgi:MerR family transcriptional regulator, mercuric resistance operon regulatory protein
MKAYTVSRLAEDAGVSVHVVRDYELRGLLCPCRCTPNGYRIYDEQVLQRLQFILAGKAAGISLSALSELCQAMDNSDPKAVKQSMTSIGKTLDQSQQAIRYFRRSLNCCIESEVKKKTSNR